MFSFNNNLKNKKFNNLLKTMCVQYYLFYKIL